VAVWEDHLDLDTVCVPVMSCWSCEWLFGVSPHIQQSV